MSTIAKDIREGIEAVVLSNLDASYQLLNYKFDVGQNDFRANRKGYAVVQQEAFRIAGTTRAITKERRYEIILVDNFKNRVNDNPAQAVIDELEDKISEINRDLHLSKAGVASVLVVNFDELVAPEIDNQNNIVIMRNNVLVQYREVIN